MFTFGCGRYKIKVPRLLLSWCFIATANKGKPLFITQWQKGLICVSFKIGYKNSGRGIKFIYLPFDLMSDHALETARAVGWNHNRLTELVLFTLCSFSTIKIYYELSEFQWFRTSDWTGVLNSVNFDTSMRMGWIRSVVAYRIECHLKCKHVQFICFNVTSSIF